VQRLVGGVQLGHRRRVALTGVGMHLSGAAPERVANLIR
jgi:hypothetical protein